MREGDLIEFNGERFVMTGRQRYGSHIWATPATAKGRADRRKYPTLLEAERCTVIKATTEPTEPQYF